jgi:hypothetical protein
MTLSREAVPEPVRQLPDEGDIEELLYRLYLLEKLAAVGANIIAKPTFSAEEIRERVCPWQP